VVVAAPVQPGAVAIGSVVVVVARAAEMLCQVWA
jgi:hypothetical protein